MGGSLARISGILVALAVLGAASTARAGLFLPIVLRPVPSTLSLEPTPPAMLYGRLARGACEAELGRRAIPFVHVDEARGVLSPVRLVGPLHGVTFASWLPEAQRAMSPLEIVDCRLALALDDFAAQLAAHGIVEVRHYSMYRPPSSRWPEDKLGARHAGGLAIDAAVFVKRDGSKLDVLHDFHGRIGARTCGHGAGPHPETPEALELRRIVCDAAEAKIFNVELTPDYNWPHRNHFHLEVSATARWFFVH
jgi:hypothetical protein